EYPRRDDRRHAGLERSVRTAAGSTTVTGFPCARACCCSSVSSKVMAIDYRESDSPLHCSRSSSAFPSGSQGSDTREHKSKESELRLPAPFRPRTISAKLPRTSGERGK